MNIEKRNDTENEETRLERADNLTIQQETEENPIINEPVLPSILHQALITNDKATLFRILDENSAVQLADCLSPLTDNEIILFYSTLNNDYDKLGEIFSYLPVEERKALIENLPKKFLLAVLSNVSNDDMADFLEDVPKTMREKILSMFPGKRRNIINQLSAYSDDTVGSIMTTEYLSILCGTTIEDVFKKIKQDGARLETVRSIFIVDNANKLLGVERVEDLMFEDVNRRIEDVMTKDFAYISPIADKESAVPICQEYDLPVLPVVSKNGEMLGILTFDDVMDVLEQESTEDTLKQGAVAPTDVPYMENKAYKIAMSYVIWLLILLVLNTFTGIIISRFENALLTLPILTSFIPAINDSVGNSSSQTTAMVIRSLTTGEITKKDYFKVAMREFLVGFISGLIVAVFDFGWVLLELNTPILSTESFSSNTDLIAKFGNIQNVYLAIAAITAFALLIGITFSKLFAAILPIVAKSIKIDPAVMSGPLMTCLMDIVTLLIYFGIATMLIDGIAPGTLTVFLATRF
jgi:magnesium transporter